MSEPRFQVRWAPSDYHAGGDWQVYDTTDKLGVIGGFPVCARDSLDYRDFLESLAIDWAARLNHHPEDA